MTAVAQLAAQLVAQLVAQLDPQVVAQVVAELVAELAALAERAAFAPTGPAERHPNSSSPPANSRNSAKNTTRCPKNLHVTQCRILELTVG